MRFLSISMVVFALGMGGLSMAKASTDWGEWMESRNNVDRGRCIQAKNEGDQSAMSTYCPPNERY